MPLVGYNREMVDTLHFFVYNTHNLFMYNFQSHSYRSYVVNIKIPANFMSVENEEGRMFDPSPRPLLRRNRAALGLCAAKHSIGHHGGAHCRASAGPRAAVFSLSY